MLNLVPINYLQSQKYKLFISLLVDLKRQFGHKSLKLAILKRKKIKK